MARLRRADFHFTEFKIRPNTDISGIKLVPFECPCGSRFKAAKDSKQIYCSDVCAGLMSAEVRKGRARRRVCA